MTKTDPRRTLGDRGEQLAADHLERQGFTIVARQHRTRFGEIDLIAWNGATLAFCEVKTRRSASRIWDAIDARKQRQVRRMAAAYLAETPDHPRAQELRFDAIGVVIDGRGQLVDLQHLKGAF